jgi:hypothetical protein
MKKIFIVFLALALLSGCQDSGTTENENPFVEGTNGILVDFIQDSPPSEVFDKSSTPFEIDVELKNEGEFDVAASDVVVKIVGIDPAEFGSAELTASPEDDLDGVSKDSAGNKQDGTITEVRFEDLVYEDEIVGANAVKNIVADVCYEYGTTAVADVCILKDSSKDKSSVCKVGETKKVYSSGAPVKVSSFTERPAGKNRIEFEFSIEKAGSVKKIYKEGTDCADVRSNENVVKVDVSGIDGLSCVGLDTEGYATMMNGKKVVKCSFEHESDIDYEKTANIRLSYEVNDDAKTTISIKHTED